MKTLFCAISICLFFVIKKEPLQAFVNAAKARTNVKIIYQGKYFSIPYPNGDVPDSIGVCTDVIIRSYRQGLGVDLQKYIHEDMTKHFEAYPALWGLTKPDPNIDHRRTQNQECFFKRHGAALKISKYYKDYQPGDMVYYGDIASGHVAIVVDEYVNDSIPLVVHNIGNGPVMEAFLFKSRITGHYRWVPEGI